MRANTARPNPVKRLLVTAMAVLLICGIGVFAFNRIAHAVADAKQQATALQTRSVSFLAVGDNLPDNGIGAWADAQAGAPGDGVYDFSGLYAPIKDYVQNADLAYCKEETHCGGDEIGPKGYPSFNTPDATADALIDTGFDLIGSATNHCYDWGYFDANDHSCQLWAGKDVVFTGTYNSQKAYESIATKTVNDITFSLLDYTYGVNGYTQSQLPPHTVKFIDKDLIASDVAKAREISDVVIVVMHWGTENQTEPDALQLEYAQFCADLGVDIVVGSHPHVIGPLAWLDGKDGKKTLCAYSLGNFISNHEAPGFDNELEGMLTCTFMRSARNAQSEGDKASDARTDKKDSAAEEGVVTSTCVKDGIEYTISIADVTWIPLVNHTTASDHAVYALKDYTEELADAHSCFGGDGKAAIAWLRERSHEVVNSLGSEFTIDDTPGKTAA